MAADAIVAIVLLGGAALISVRVGTHYIGKASRGRMPPWYWYTRGITWLAIAFGVILALKALQPATVILGIALGVQVATAWIVRPQTPSHKS